MSLGLASCLLRTAFGNGLFLGRRYFGLYLLSGKVYEPEDLQVHASFFQFALCRLLSESALISLFIIRPVSINRSQVTSFSRSALSIDDSFRAASQSIADAVLWSIPWRDDPIIVTRRGCGILARSFGHDSNRMVM